MTLFIEQTTHINKYEPFTPTIKSELERIEKIEKYHYEQLKKDHPPTSETSHQATQLFGTPSTNVKRWST